MGYGSLAEYEDLLDQLFYTNTSRDIVANLMGYRITIYKADLEDSYGKPMKAIGVYIAIASLCCLLAMVADLFNGFRSKMLWFPVKYFPLNALTLAGIAVAMKLPVDLSGSMLGDIDQVAKLGSLAFLSIMMAHFLPSLANMNKNELFTNIIALGILVITLVVNVGIQINSGVVGRIPIGHNLKNLGGSEVISNLIYIAIAIIYVIFLLFLLIIHVSSSLAILKSKEIIELKYQQGHEEASNDLKSSGEFLDVEKLQQHVSKYWIMAKSGSPQTQLISACSSTTTAASGVICVLIFIFHFILMIRSIVMTKNKIKDKESVVLYDSAYNWSTCFIFIVQSIGIVVGTVAPLFRCFSSISFKLTIKSMSNLFKVEKCWTGKLYDWKYGSITLPLVSISLPFGNHKLKVVIRTLKNLFLNFCIILQVVVVVVCKIMVLNLFFPKLFLCCLKWLLQVNHIKNKERYGIYVMQPLNENELLESTLTHLLKHVNGLIQKSEKKQPKNLMKLIQEKSTEGFQGVRMFDNDVHGVKCSPSKVEYQDCWSLLVVTLTTIAITLPNIEKVKVKILLKSVREGLEYVTLVEETLNSDDDYERTQKAAKKLWEEVDFRHKWLGIKLKDIASQVNTVASHVDTTLQIIEKFLENANKKIVEGRGSLDDESKFTSICASSMSRISQTIINDQESHNKLFDELSSMIADIMAACLTDLPQAIAKKCHSSVVEKREASVEAAAKLLGETKQIIITLEDPNNKWNAYLRMATEDRPFINKWRAHLSEP